MMRTSALDRQTVDEAVAVPLQEHLGAAVEHQLARSDHWRPIEHRLCQVERRLGFGNGQAVMILAIEDRRPAIILALLDQAQLVAAARAMLDLPQFEPQVRSQFPWRTRIPTSGHWLCGCAR